MAANSVLWNLCERGVATITLNRPEVNNAYDAGLIQGLLAAMDDLARPKTPASRRCPEGQRKTLSGRRRSEMDQWRAAKIACRERGGFAGHL